MLLQIAPAGFNQEARQLFNSNFYLPAFRYLLPRPLRLFLTGFGSASCLVATVISATRFLSVCSKHFHDDQHWKADLCFAEQHKVYWLNAGQELKYQTGDNDASTVVINLLGFIGFGALFFLDRQAATDRVARREKVVCSPRCVSVIGMSWCLDITGHACKHVDNLDLQPLPILLQVRKAQVAIGDREVYTNAEGERMSRLKEVNSDWIIRRLERWGRRVGLVLYAFIVGAAWNLHCLYAL